MKRVIIHTDGPARGTPARAHSGRCWSAAATARNSQPATGSPPTTGWNCGRPSPRSNCYPKPCEVELHSDSKYLVQAITRKWLQGWQRRGWLTPTKQPVKNRDLWLALMAAMAPIKSVAVGERPRRQCGKTNAATNSPISPWRGSICQMTPDSWDCMIMNPDGHARQPNPGRGKVLLRCFRRSLCSP